MANGANRSRALAPDMEAAIRDETGRPAFMLLDVAVYAPAI